MHLLPVVAWLLLAAVAVVALAPIGLRPITGYSPNIERFMAFGAVGLLFALTYPRHLWMSLALVLGAAIALEALRVFDLAVKLAGGGLGIAAGVVARQIWRRVVAGRAT